MGNDDVGIYDGACVGSVDAAKVGDADGKYVLGSEVGSDEVGYSVGYDVGSAVKVSEGASVGFDGLDKHCMVSL